MPARAVPRVVVAGELMLDVLLVQGEPDPGEAVGHATSTPGHGLFVRPGGSAANTARGLAGMGVSSVILGRTGLDPNGAWLTGKLSSPMISLPLSCEPSLVTGYVIIHRRRWTDHVAFVERGANRSFGVGGATDGHLEGARWLHVSGYCLIEPGPAAGVQRLAAEARRRGIPVSLDPGVPRAFQALGRVAARELCRLGLAGGPDVLLPSRGMATFLGGAAAALVVVKDGFDGAVVAGRRVPQSPEEVVPGADVSGAGDVFNAGYIAAALSGASPAEAAAGGNQAAFRYVREAVLDESSPGQDWTRVTRQEPPLLVSACVLGTAAAYDGKARGFALAEEETRPDRRLCLPVCPEQAGGLETPRAPSEIRGGGGHDVIFGRAVVLNRDGREVTEAFLKGARRTLGLARAVGASRALLKDGSPSCGVRLIHDGTFTGARTAGRGVTAAALERLGLDVEPVGD